VRDLEWRLEKNIQGEGLMVGRGEEDSGGGDEGRFWIWAKTRRRRRVAE